MFLRAVAAFLVLPGIVAFAGPVLIAWPIDAAHLQPAGLVPLAIGTALLLWCVRDFYVAGKGTLAPWAPPQRLVTVGLYRFSRNPMYLAVLAILCGWAVLLDSGAVWSYAGCVALAFHVRVLWSEEPFLARTHGDAWVRYRRQVRRWI
jgi:protein-S-isoprenylcysteine O-methyltransferase Ste14